MELALIKKMDFRFSNLMHSAVVSIAGTPDEMFVHVQLVHSFLRKLVGVEHIRFFNNHGDIKLQAPSIPFAWQVAAAVNEKLNEELEIIENDCLHLVQ